MKIIQIVPRLPPAICGVGDYGYLLARQLRAVHGIQTIFVVCGESDSLVGGSGGRTPATDCRLPGLEELDGFAVRRLAERNAGELLRLLSLPGMPQTVLLHYVPYGYAKRGCPVWLTRALCAWRKGDAVADQASLARRVVTMFHELFAFGPPWRSSFWTSPVQRWVAKSLANVSSQCLTNRTAAAAWLSSAGKHSRNSIQVLPVFSNLGELAEVPSLLRRKPQMVVYGKESLKASHRKLAIEAVRRVCTRMGIDRLVLLGDGGDSPWRAAGLTTEVTGVLRASEISRLLSESRVGYVDYYDGYLGRSGIFAAFCAHGLVPMLLFINHSEEDGLKANQHFVAASALPQSFDAMAQQDVAAQAHLWYAGHSMALTANAYGKAINESSR